jgi:hypothetical protein
MTFHVHSMEHVIMYFHENGSAFQRFHVLDDRRRRWCVDFLISGAPCIWVNVKNTLKPTYNSPITGDFGGPDNDSDEKPGQILGPDATTCPTCAFDISCQYASSANWALLILLMKISIYLGYFRYLYITYDLLTDKICMLYRMLLMIYLWFTYSTYELLMNINNTYNTYNLLIVYLWFTYNVLMIYLWFTYFSLIITYFTYNLLILYLLFTYIVLIIYLWFTYFSLMITYFTYNLLIYNLWFTYALLMIYLWFIYSLLMIYLCFTYYTYNLLIIYFWFTYDLLMIYLQITYD